MDLEGNLAVFEPVYLFQLIAIAQCDGELTLDVGNNSARIYFEQGKVMFAEINLRSIKLGEYLVEQGVITQRALDTVLVKNRNGRKLGHLLLESGVLKKSELNSALEDQVKEVIYEVVRWRKGWFQFVTGKSPVENEVFIDIPMDHLMLEGLKRMDEDGK